MFLQAQVFLKRTDKSSRLSKNTFQIRHGVSSGRNRKGSQLSCTVFSCSKNFKSPTFSQGRKFFHKLFENMAGFSILLKYNLFLPSPAKLKVILPLVVGTSWSFVWERQTNNFVQVFFTGKTLQSPLLVVTVIFLLGP